MNKLNVFWYGESRGCGHGYGCYDSNDYELWVLITNLSEEQVQDELKEIAQKKKEDFHIGRALLDISVVNNMSIAYHDFGEDYFCGNIQGVDFGIEIDLSKYSRDDFFLPETLSKIKADREEKLKQEMEKKQREARERQIKLDKDQLKKLVSKYPKDTQDILIAGGIGLDSSVGKIS